MKLLGEAELSRLSPRTIKKKKKLLKTLIDSDDDDSDV